MDDQEKLELMEVVNQQKTFIINFLKNLNLKVKNNEVSLLFSDGEVDEATINKQSFTNLWELNYEPSLVRLHFFIEGSNESNLDLHRTMEFLLNKLISSGWHDNLYDSPNQSQIIEDNCYCFQSINIESKTIESDEIKIVLIGAIGYFN